MSNNSNIGCILNFISIHQCLIIYNHNGLVIQIEFIDGNETIGSIRKYNAWTFVHHKHIATNDWLTLTLCIYSSDSTRNKCTVAANKNVILLKTSNNTTTLKHTKLAILNKSVSLIYKYTSCVTRVYTRVL